MSLTISELIDYVRATYNSAVGDTFFTDDWMYTTIWRAETQLAVEGWVIEKTYSQSSVSGTRTLGWPHDCLAIYEVRYQGKKLLKVDIEQDPVNSTNNPSGEPAAYGIWEQQIILFPTPDTNGDTIQIRCYQNAAILKYPTDPLNVPSEYQIGLSDYVVSEMAKKDQNIALSREYKMNWDRIVEKARQNQARRKRADKQARVKDYYFGTDNINNRLSF